MANSMTVLQEAGPAGLKRDLVIVGDGFTAADQTAYNTYVQNILMAGVFQQDYFRENAASFNIYRINLESVDSGVSTHTLAPNPLWTPGSTTQPQTLESNVVTRNTALGMWFSGQWAYCWLDYGLTQAQGDAVEARLQAALTTWVPDVNNLLVVLNTAGFGGCGGGGRAHVTMGVGWDTIAHEFGHGIGGLSDEYSAGVGAYTGLEQSTWINTTTNTNRSTLRWRQFVDPTTPMPTGVGAAANYNQGTRPATWDSNQSVGAFEGGSTFDTGLYRPVENCRMNSNAPPYCPVCYTSMKNGAHDQTGYTFHNAYAGRFLGSDRTDVLLHHGTSLQLFRRNTDGFEHTWTGVGMVPGSWQMRPGDVVHVADVNGDGLDEVVIFNGTDWSMPYLGVLAHDGNGGLRLIARHDGDVPGWGGLARNDRFLVTDLNGDGRADLVVVNTADWSMVYVGLLRSNGAAYTCVNRYDGDIPGWGGLARGDEFFVGDFTGNGSGDLVIFNGTDWVMAYVGMFRSTGNALVMSQRYDGDIPGWGGLARGDKLILGDFTGDGRSDVVIFNGADWSMPYLGLFRSNSSSLTMVRRYDGDVPGWGGLARHDTFWAAKVNSRGSRCDLWAWNTEDWNQEYLGLMSSTGSGFTTQFRGDWVGEWNLGNVDRFEVAAAHTAQTSELFVHNKDWFGVISGRDGIFLERLYYRWVHDYTYGRNWCKGTTMADNKNPDAPIIRRVHGEEKVAPQSYGRQRYLDPDLQPRYDGAVKVARDQVPQMATQGDLKAESERRRTPRRLKKMPSPDLAPMQPPSQEDSEGQLRESQEQYVRLRVRVEGETLTILDSHLVDGPLREGASFPGRFAYDVTVGEELLHAGPAPDLGIRRSFINPQGPEEEQTHLLTEMSSFVFTARVPAEVVTADVLPDIRVRLLRLKEEAVAPRTTLEPVDVRFPAQARVVAEVVGLPRSALPASISRRGGITGRGETN